MFHIMCNVSVTVGNMHFENLKQVNISAARFITHNYTHSPGITTHIKNDKHRQARRLTTMYKIINNLIDINKQEEKHSFFPRTIQWLEQATLKQKTRTLKTFTDKLSKHRAKHECSQTQRLLP